MLSQHALQQVSGGVSQHALQFPGPHARGEFRGIWSRPTPKEKLRGSSQGVPARGVPAPGGVETPP